MHQGWASGWAAGVGGAVRLQVPSELPSESIVLRVALFARTTSRLRQGGSHTTHSYTTEETTDEFHKNIALVCTLRLCHQSTPRASTTAAFSHDTSQTTSPPKLGHLSNHSLSIRPSAPRQGSRI
jgi:hypothetical protein